MKTIYLILLSFIFFTSCITPNRMDRKCRKAKTKYELSAVRWHCPVVSDSIMVQSQVVIRDTTVFVTVPAQAVHDSIPVIITQGLMNSSVSNLETAYSVSKAWVANGILLHTLNQKPSAIPLTFPGAIRTSTASTIKTIKVPYYIDRPISKPLHWWQNLFIWSGVILWWVVGLYIVKKFYKFKTG